MKNKGDLGKKKKNKEEIEVKFRVKELASYRGRLKNLKAKVVWSGLESNIYFEGRNSFLSKQSKVLRAREWPGHSVSLTCKASIPGKSNSKYDERIEEQVSLDGGDFDSLCKILEMVGFHKLVAYKKRREHWQMNKNVFVELDMFHGKPFVEIEATKDKIDEIAKLLGLDWEDRETKSYFKLAKERQGKK